MRSSSPLAVAVVGVLVSVLLLGGCASDAGEVVRAPASVSATSVQPRESSPDTTASMTTAPMTLASWPASDIGRYERVTLKGVQSGNLTQLLTQNPALAHESSPTWLIENRPPPRVHLLVMSSNTDPQSYPQAL